MDLKFSSTIFLGCFVILLFILRYLKKSYSFWEKIGVPYLKPNIIFGNFKDVLLMRITPIDFHLQIYKMLAPHKFGGLFLFQKPMLLVRDTDLIKRILTKDFDSFPNRGIEMDSKLEPLTRHLFTLEGEEWRNLRVRLTCTFTTGKMKMMFPLMEECAMKLTQFLNESASKNEGVEIKDLFARYATDVIGSCAFGINTCSIENPHSEFRVMGKKFFQRQYKTMLRMLFPSIPPIIIKLFGLRFVDEDVSDYFTSIVEDTVKFREEYKVRRNDFLDILIDLKNNTDLENENEENSQNCIADHKKHENKIKIDMTPQLMAAQCFLFFIAGFESTSNTLSFLFLELAQNQDIQDKLREEVIAVLNAHNQILSYDTLKEMKYLDMVLGETLRKYSPVVALSRICIKNYKIPDTNITIPKGTQVVIPVFGLHRDNQYYNNPEIFNPDNFTEESKSKRPHYSYIPFGEGPRVCIAERFARMEVKLASVHLITHYKFELSPKMKIPIKFEYTFGLLAAKGGIWLQCSKINNC